MTSELTILLCVLGLAAITFLACADSINIFRHLVKQKLTASEKITVLFFSLLMPGFNILGYAHFHEKDFRQCLAEFKKFSLYRDFFVCHSWFFILLICLEPSILWDALHDIVFASFLYLALIPLSLVFSFFSFLVQLPNFFDRHSIIFDEPQH